jgi:hypothetical protein
VWHRGAHARTRRGAPHARAAERRTGQQQRGAAQRVAQRDAAAHAERILNRQRILAEARPQQVRAG